MLARTTVARIRHDLALTGIFAVPQVLKRFLRLQRGRVLDPVTWTPLLNVLTEVTQNRL